MQTFPDYDAEIAKVENLGLAGHGMALKKRANWISFIKVRRPVVTVTCHKVSSAQAKQPGSTRSGHIPIVPSPQCPKKTVP